MKRINVEDIFKNADEKDEFNRPDLNEIEFWYKGKKVDIPTEEIGWFTFSGLLNTDFAMMRDWDKTSQKKQ